MVNRLMYQFFKPLGLGYPNAKMLPRKVMAEGCQQLHVSWAYEHKKATQNNLLFYELLFTAVLIACSFMSRSLLRSMRIDCSFMSYWSEHLCVINEKYSSIINLCLFTRKGMNCGFCRKLFNRGFIFNPLTTISQKRYTWTCNKELSIYGW